MMLPTFSLADVSLEKWPSLVSFLVVESDERLLVFFVVELFVSL